MSKKLKEQPKPQEMTLEEHQQLFTEFANKNCKKCYGRGYIGWQVIGGKKVIVPCKAKKCSVYNLYAYQIQQKRNELLAKQKLREMEEADIKGKKENDN